MPGALPTSDVPLDRLTEAVISRAASTSSGSKPRRPPRRAGLLRSRATDRSMPRVPNLSLAAAISGQFGGGLPRMEPGKWRQTSLSRS
jgi:hypothetical protein